MRAGQVFACGPFTTTAHETFDFETYSEAGYVWDAVACKWGSLPGLANTNRGLGAVGVANYVAHPSFGVLSLSYDLLDGAGTQRWVPVLHDFTGLPTNPPQPLLDHVAAGGTLEAWNVGFELQVWNGFCVLAWGWPPLLESQVRCCMAKARAAAYPGALGNAGAVLQLVNQKDKDGDRLIKLLTVPRNPTKANPALRCTPFTHTEDFQKLYDYNDQDVRAEIEASTRIPDLSPFELAVWRMDLRVNTRGMQVDSAAVENCIQIAEQAFARGNAELAAITGGAVQGSSEVAKMIKWMHGRGVYLHELDEETVEKALTIETDPAVLRVLRIRQQMAFGSVKKLYAFRAQTTAAGRLHDQYVYYGAHTGLWNGRGVQPANLYKGIFSKPEQVERALAVIASRSLEFVEYEYPDTDALEVVASCLRSMIIARPGHRLISADFTAIQAVATSALAGEEWRLEVFRTHGRIYESMASQLTGKPLQFYADYKREQGKHHDDRQTYGKIPVLSADFGAWIEGWKRFGADKLGDDDTIKRLILQTRDRIPNIVEFWGGQVRDKFRPNERAELYGLEGAAVSAVLYPGQAFGYRGVRFQQFEDTLYCMPPSGGIIRYHAPRLEPSTRNYARPWELSLSYTGWNSNPTKGAPGWHRMDLYGGVFTQNVVSHECREIQALCLLRMEDNGYPIVMHTHDEGVSEVPIGQGSLAEYMRLYRILPDWARTPDGQPWPIKVPDGWEALRYGKWED